MKQRYLFLIILLQGSVMNLSSLLSKALDKTSEQNKALLQEGYSPEFVTIIEQIYGKGFLSQGQTNGVDELFEGLDLNGKKILDLGCGLGGPAMYLAQKYKVEVVALDPLPRVLEQLEKNIAEQKDTFKGTVTPHEPKGFYSLSEFQDNTFDIIYSKEVLLHVPFEKKSAYLKEMHRVLKPVGKLIILDWLKGDKALSKETMHMMELDNVPFHLLTVQAYLNDVSSLFTSVSLNDFTPNHEKLTTDNIIMLNEQLKESIVKQFGEQDFNDMVESYKCQERAFKEREILVYKFVAEK